MKKEILVIPNNFDTMGYVIKKDIDGVILPLKDFSVEQENYYTLEEIKTILNLTSKNVYLLINKIMHNNDLQELENEIVKLNKLNISGIFFYDLSIINITKRLMIKKPLIIWQDHLNLSSLSNSFYNDIGIKASVISNDITKEEINKINTIKKMMVVYGYLPMFYSRRYLLSNYADHIEENKGKINYLLHENKKYRVEEEKYGTCIYTSDYINLINDIDDLNIDTIILNTSYIDKDIFYKDLDKFINNIKDSEEHYKGFLNKNSVYRKCDYDKD